MEFYRLNLTDNPFWYKEQRLPSSFLLRPLTYTPTLITITVLWIASIVEGFLRNIIREIIGKDARALRALSEVTLSQTKETYNP